MVSFKLDNLCFTLVRLPKVYRVLLVGEHGFELSLAIFYGKDNRLERRSVGCKWSCELDDERGE